MCAFASLKPLFKQEIQIAPKIGMSSTGEPIYGMPVTYKANISYRPRQTRGIDGQTILAVATAEIFQWDIPLTTEDQITMPDGSQPVIVGLLARPCEAGHLHKAVMT